MAAVNGGTGDYLETTVLVTGNASSAFGRVAFRAGAGSDNGYNTDEGLIIVRHGPDDQNGNRPAFAPISGAESVCGCSFSGHNGVEVRDSRAAG